MTKLSIIEPDSFIGWPFYRPAFSSNSFPSLSSFFDDPPSYEYSDGKLTINLAGFKKDQISVEIQDNVLYIKAKNDKHKISQSFYLGLNVDIDTVNTKARLEDGILTIDLQRLVSASSSKTVINIE